MIENFSIGIDICEIDRFKKMPFLTNKKFYKKIFTPLEIKYCNKYKNPYPHFAGKFAVKEAVIKSINLKLNLLNIVTSHSNSKPNVVIKSSQKKFIFKISITHESNLAIAVVLSECVS